MIHTECRKVYEPNNIDKNLLLWLEVKTEVMYAVDSCFDSCFDFSSQVKPSIIWHMTFLDTVYGPYD